MESLPLQIYSFAYNLISQLGVSIPPGILQVALIGTGVFLFTLLLGLARHHMLAWSIKGAWFGFLLGMVLLLILEGFLLVGGKTAISELVKNKRTPENVRVFLEKNMTELAQSLSNNPKALGASTKSGNPSASFVSQFENLPRGEQDAVKEEICQP